jgi:predicted phage-related endonuclease
MRSLWDMRQSGVVVHSPTNKHDWHSLRRRAVTASQVGALFGVHEFTTPLELWGQKAGWIQTGDDSAENPVLTRGELLEDDALELLARGNRDWVIQPNVIGDGGVYLEHAAKKLGGTPDAFALPSSSERAIVEIKTTDWSTFQSKWGGPHNPEPPLWIAIQAMLLAHLADTDHAYVCCMVVGRTLDLHIMRVDVIPALIDKTFVLADAFWATVDSGNPPNPDYARDGKMIEAMLPYDLGTEVDLSHDNEFVDACARYVALRTDIKLATEGLDQHAALIRHKLGTHSTAKAAGYRISNKRIERKSYVVAATAYRKLTIAPPREE